MTISRPDQPDKPFNIICADPTPAYVPLGLGMCLALARRRLPAEGFTLGPTLVPSPENLKDHFQAEARNILLCSNYFWNTGENLDFSRQAKALDPDCLVIHGGPNTPGYPQACQAFLQANPEIDYAVIGEGEVTLVGLLLTLAGERAGLPDGVSTLEQGRLVRSGKRRPTKDLSQFPSPYLDGLFDFLDPAVCIRAAVETNRGCPYGCVYCSWSHPLDAVGRHRMSFFDLERVAEEINWVAKKSIPRLFITDSNFGHFERDVQIAEIILEARLKYGFPKIVTVNYAKNNHRHILAIVEILEKKKMLSDGGIISLQTRDPATLEVIRRKNIRTDDYDRLKEGFDLRNLPLNVQLMFGLPGATPEAFRNDLAYYFGRNLELTIFRVIVLPNSPMADPAYGKKHQIVTDEHNLVISTAAMSGSDMEEMKELGCLFDAVHNLGVLRLPLLWLNWEKGLDVVDLLHQLVLDQKNLGVMPQARSGLPRGYPRLVHTAFRARKKAALFDWPAFHDEFVAWLENRYHLQRQNDLNSLLMAQTAIMPVEQRDYPYEVKLPHDVLGWYIDRIQKNPRPLAEYPPAKMVVKEPLRFWRRWLRKHQLPAG
jgi:hypothetical protein